MSDILSSLSDQIGPLVGLSRLKQDFAKLSTIPALVQLCSHFHLHMGNIAYGQDNVG